MSSFRSHGTVKLDVIDIMLVVEEVGPLNVEALMSPATIASPVIKQLSSTKSLFMCQKRQVT
jgi:hypothetical protein